MTQAIVNYITDMYDPMTFVVAIMNFYSPITVDVPKVRDAKKNEIVQHYNSAMIPVIGKDILRDLGENSLTRVFAALQIILAIRKITNENAKDLSESEIATPTKTSTTKSLATKPGCALKTTRRLKPNLSLSKLSETIEEFGRRFCKQRSVI